MSKNDMVQLADGTQIPLCRPNSVNDKDWASVKDYLKTHPNEAKALQKSVQGVTENPMQLDQFREVMALAETCCFSTPCTHALIHCWLVVTGDSTGLVVADRSAGGLR